MLVSHRLNPGRACRRALILGVSLPRRSADRGQAAIAEPCRTTWRERTPATSLASIRRYNLAVGIEIRGIEWDSWNENHIAEHGVSRTEVEEICRGRRPADPAREDRVRVVGRTSAGRVIVVILEPLDSGWYYCVTAFPATGRTRREFLRQEQRSMS